MIDFLPEEDVGADSIRPGNVTGNCRVCGRLIAAPTWVVRENGRIANPSARRREQAPALQIVKQQKTPGTERFRGFLRLWGWLDDGREKVLIPG